MAWTQLIALQWLTIIICHANNIIITNHADTQLWWLAFYVSNEDLSCGGSITKIEIKDNNAYTSWYANNPTYNQWGYYGFDNNGNAFTTPISIRITRTHNSETETITGHKPGRLLC